MCVFYLEGLRSNAVLYWCLLTSLTKMAIPHQFHTLLSPPALKSITFVCSLVSASWSVHEDVTPPLTFSPLRQYVELWLTLAWLPAY